MCDPAIMALWDHIGGEIVKMAALTILTLAAHFFFIRFKDF